MSITIGQADPAWVSPLVNFLAVVLGGLLTWATTRHFEQKRQRNQDHALAYALVFKIQSLTDEIWKIDREIKNAIKRAAAENFHGPLWAILDEIIGLDESLERISAEELTLVARTKDADLVIKIREIESGHTILKMVLAKIHELRASPDLRKHAKSVKGRVVSFAGNQEEFPAIAHIFRG